MYSNRWIYRIQTCWIITVGFIAAVFIKACDWSLWLRIPFCAIGSVMLIWIGISLLALFDYNHRMAARYGVKIENLPLYFSLFESMVEKEAQGIDTSGIPKEVSDVEDWIRFCRWQAAENFKKLQHGTET